MYILSSDISNTSVIGLVVKFSVAIRATSGSPGFDSQITQYVLFLSLQPVYFCCYNWF
ncbi:hypothetical protein ACQKWADRAFT_297503 [Trichoderma austrokoningii]